jgi:hypothetical protein
VALVDQTEEGAKGVVDVPSVLLALCGQGDQLQLPQGLQTVVPEVDLVVDGGVAELRAGFDVEEEQEPIHDAQAFQRELVCVQLPLAGEDAFLLLPRTLDELARGLVAKQLDGLSQGVLQVFRDTIGVLVGVEKTLPRALRLVRQDALPVQEHAHGLEGVGLPAGE